MTAPGESEDPTRRGQYDGCDRSPLAVYEQEPLPFIVIVSGD